MKMTEIIEKIPIKELDLELINPNTYNYQDMTKGSKIVIVGKPGCFLRGTQILMHDSSLKSVEDIKVGDVVMGDDFTPRTVLDTCYGMDRMYIIRYQYSYYIVNSQHILCLYDITTVQEEEMTVHNFLLLPPAEQLKYRIYQNIPNHGKKYHIFRVIFSKLDNYYGFVIGNNHKFLLADYSVVHNTGKCLHPEQEIISYFGSLVKAKNVKVNDLLMGDDGLARRVTSITTGKEEMFKIVPKFGESYIVNRSHILSLWNIQKGEVEDIPLINYKNLSEEKKSEYRSYRYKSELEFMDMNVFDDEKKFINPYFYGYWLGCNTYSEAPHTTLINYLKVLYVQKEEFIVKIYDSVCFLDPSNVDLELVVTTPYKRELFLLGFYDAWAITNNRIPSNFVFMGENYQPCLDPSSKVIQIIDSYRISSQILHILKYLAYLNKFIIEENKNILSFIRMDDNLDNPIVKICSLGMDRYYGFTIDEKCSNRRFLLWDCTVTHNTTLIKSIMYWKKHIFPISVAFSGTEDSNRSYEEFMPFTYVYDGMEEPALEDKIRRQKIALNEHVTNPWAVILVDDCADDPKLLNRKLFNGIFKNGRHWGMLFILSLQWGLDIKPVIRTNIDGVFILRETNRSNRERLYRNYASSCFKSQEQFDAVMDDITEDFTALYIHNQSTSNKFEDCVFFYTAKPEQIPEDWRFGCDEFWECHEERKDLEYKKI